MVFQNIRNTRLKNHIIDYNDNTVLNFPFGKAPELADKFLTDIKVADDANIAWSKISKAASSMSDLGDTFFENIQENQVIKWDGFKWINSDPPAPTNTTTVVNQGTTWDPNAPETLMNKTMDYTANTFLNFPIPATVLPDRTTTIAPKFGRFFGGSAQGDALLAGLTVNGTLSAADYPEGQHTVFNTATVDQALGGFSTSVSMTRRAYNPTFKISFRNVVTTERMFVGLVSQASQPTNSDTPLNSKSGIGVLYSDQVNNFTGMWNNGAGTQQSITSSTAKDSNNHVIIITLNDSTPRAILNFDGTDLINTTTNVPGSATALWLHCNLESIGTSGGTFAVAYAWCIQDK